jgi:hypothetical protein
MMQAGIAVPEAERATVNDPRASSRAYWEDGARSSAGLGLVLV